MTAGAGDRPPSRWEVAAGDSSGPAYEARFARLAARGVDVHGEADLCARLVGAGARVLDAGCGTGRVAVRLSELGYRCVGVDQDASMLARAQASSSDVHWVSADLADQAAMAELGTFDLVLAAGNVLPLLAVGTEAAVVAALAARLEPSAPLVVGFGLDPAHLPLARAPFGLAEYDRWCAAAGLVLEQRWATWDGAAYVVGGGYAVSLHRRG